MENNNSFKKYLTFGWELFKIALIALVIVAPIRYFLFQPFIVSGESMFPNFESGDYLIIDEISYRFSVPQRGEVIVFNTDFIPGYKGERFIKRIVGLPGEAIDIAQGKVKISKDGESFYLDEKYLPTNIKTYGDKNIVLNQGQYFVMGDNREYSYDSRVWGAVDKKFVIGKVLLRVLPINQIKAFYQPN